MGGQLVEPFGQLVQPGAKPSAKWRHRWQRRPIWLLLAFALAHLNDPASHLLQSGLTTEQLSLFDQLFDAVLITSADLEAPGPTIVYVNAACERLTGYTAQELVGRSPRLLQGPSTDKQVLDSLKRSLRAGQPCLASTVNYRKDGSAFHIEWSVSPLRDSGGTISHFVAIQRDVTARAVSDQTQAENDRLIAQAQRFGRIGFWKVSLKDGGEDFWASPGLCSLLDLPESISGKEKLERLRAKLYPSDYSHFVARIRETITSRKPLEIELRLLSDGTAPQGLLLRADVVDNDASRAPYLVGIGKDITERQLATRALIVAEERFRAAAEANLDGLFLLQAVRDDRGEIIDFRYEYVSQRAAETVRLPLERFRGNTLLTLVPGAAQSGSFEDMKRVVQTGTPMTKEVHPSHASSQSRWLYHQIVKVHDGVAISVRDNTEHRDLEQRYYQSQKLESVGRLAGGVSHDFNNVLSAILGFADFIAASLPSDSPLQEDVAEIIKNARRASKLTQQLLAFSRQQWLDAHVINPAQLVEGLLGVLHTVMGEAVQIRTTTQADLWSIKADPSQIEQVVLNLAINAHDAMSGRGSFHIDLQNVEFEGPEASTVGDYVLMRFTDTGCGMTPEVKARLFEPFFTTKPVGVGTGLGLATAYGIIQQSGGFISVESEESQGAVFSIYLPRSQEIVAAPPAAKKQDDIDNTAGQGEIILVAEDDPSVLYFTCRLLTEAGYKVLESADGETAVALVEKTPKIDLLITDVVMPKLNGIELAARYKQLAPSGAVIFMSGYWEGTAGGQPFLQQNDQLLRKPIEPRRLLSVVREQLSLAQKQT